MRSKWRTLSSLVGTCGLIGGLVVANPGLVAASTAAPASTGTTRCTGSLDTPGVLAGTYDNVLVTGNCIVNAGPVDITGNLTVAAGATLAAIYGLDDTTMTGNSNMTVQGNLYVKSGASLMLGCYSRIVTNWGAYHLLKLPDFPCTDDPNQSAPTLNSNDVVDGNLISDDPLGTVVHNTVVHGNVIQTGGGAGLGCAPVGIFNKYFGLPDYTVYANVTIGKSLSVKGLDTCWMGIIRSKVQDNMTVDNDTGVGDAQEIVTNVVQGDLFCSGNTPAVELGDSDGHPNQVGGSANGQCGFHVSLPNPAFNDGVHCPPCHRTWQPASTKLS
jgi:hypothetical protein